MLLLAAGEERRDLRLRIDDLAGERAVFRRELRELVDDGLGFQGRGRRAIEKVGKVRLQLVLLNEDGSRQLDPRIELTSNVVVSVCPSTMSFTVYVPGATRAPSGVRGVACGAALIG